MLIKKEGAAQIVLSTKVNVVYFLCLMVLDLVFYISRGRNAPRRPFTRTPNLDDSVNFFWSPF